MLCRFAVNPGLPLSQPRSQSSSVISDVTPPVRARQVCLENLLGSEPPSLTRRVGMGTRLPLSVVRSARPSKCDLTYITEFHTFIYLFFLFVIFIHLKCITALFTNMRILKFKSQLTIAFFAAVNHLNGPLRKQNFTLTGSKGQGL